MKITKRNDEKKKQLHECAKLAQNMLCFPIKQWAKITFYKLYNTQKPQKYAEKNYRSKLQKITITN